MTGNEWRLYLNLNPDDPFWTDAEGTLSRGAMGAAIDARADEFRQDVSGAGQRVVLAAHPTRETVITLLGALFADRTVVLLPLREPAARQQALAQGVATNEAQPGQIWVRTSGTGGQARWLVHLPLTLMAAAEAASTRLGFGRGKAWRVSLPLDHVGGLSLIWRALVAGGALLATDDTARETHRSLVPTQLHRLLAGGEAHQLRHLRCLLLGGAPIPVHLRQEALAAGLPLVVSYGLTETGALLAASLPGDLLLAEEHFAGRPLWPSGVGVDDQGVVRVSGPSLAVGRADDEGQVDLLQLDHRGQLVTGDLGRLEGDALYITGRIDNLIISGGEKLAAEELETALLALPGVTEAVVVPVEQGEFGQRPVAFLDTTPAHRWSTTAVREALSPHLASWKLPIRVLDLPAAAGLKRDRSALIAMARATT